jgi:hypothetical protein
MEHLILEFWSEGKKQAECPADEVWTLPKDKQEQFWKVQNLLDRAVIVRYEGGTHNEK